MINFKKHGLNGRPRMANPTHFNGLSTTSGSYEKGNSGACFKPSHLNFQRLKISSISIIGPKPIQSYSSCTFPQKIKHTQTMAWVPTELS